MIVADHARDLPCAIFVLPEVDEPTFADSNPRLVSRMMETEYAGFERAVSLAPPWSWLQGAFGSSDLQLTLLCLLTLNSPMRKLLAISLVLVSLCGMATMTACSSPSSSSSFIMPPPPPPPPADPVGTNLTQMSSDPFTVGPGQHATEVEPHMFANGATLVAAFQVGRIAPGCATDIGWATSTDGGNTWTHGALPGLTTGEGSGPYFGASDPAVAYDSKHALWMIASLPCDNTAPAVTVSRSADGVNWLNPVSVDPGALGSDKDWIACDNSPASPFYGNCYVEWDDPTIRMSTSSDGGATWSAPATTADSATGIDGQPVVQRNGTVVVPVQLDSGNLASFTSSDGGASWSATATISNLQIYFDPGIRSGPALASAIDATGTVWALWVDCRFRANCSANDLVYITSTDGVNWSAVTRVPIDAVSSTVDHFIPGIGIDAATSGATAHVGITYYYYPQSNCTSSTCQLFVGFIGSSNGGATWNTPVTLTSAPMTLSWLANSQYGPMVGDYIATVFSNGVPLGVFAVARANSGTTFDEAMYTGQGLAVTAVGTQLSSAGDRPLHKLSDRIMLRRQERATPPK